MHHYHCKDYCAGQSLAHQYPRGRKDHIEIVTKLHYYG